jgi:hypothetical protein
MMSYAECKIVCLTPVTYGVMLHNLSAEEVLIVELALRHYSIAQNFTNASANELTEAVKSAISAIGIQRPIT